MKKKNSGSSQVGGGGKNLLVCSSIKKTILYFIDCVMWNNSLHNIFVGVTIALPFSANKNSCSLRPFFYDSFDDRTTVQEYETNLCEREGKERILSTSSHSAYTFTQYR